MSDPSSHVGYVGHAVYEATGARVVVYVAQEQGLDVDGRYAVVCELHSTLVGETSKRKAFRTARHPEFCEDCMNAKKLLR